MTQLEADKYIERVVECPRATSAIVGLLLVGSFARGDFRNDSDLDLVVLTDDLQGLLSNQEWLRSIGNVKEINEESWGVVTSLRVIYDTGVEIEFAIAATAWARFNPIDPGTLKVVSDGAKIIWDPHGHLKRLLEKATS